MGGITPGALDTCDPATPLGECSDQEPLRHRVARETIRGGDDHPCTGGHGRPIPEAIETGTGELGPARAVVALDRLVGDMPIGVRRTVVAEATQWVFNRRRRWLTRRRDTGVESDCQETPPDEAMAQGCCLRCVP